MPHSTIDVFAPAHVLLKALQEGSISASALLELYLERIARYNPQLKAIVVLNEERARQQARDADRARTRGALACPLHGLPITVKDCLEVAGLPSTMGLPERANSLSMQNGPVVQSLLSAGGVLLGKTNVSPYAGDWHAHNKLFGRTDNPWDAKRTPGGSTGGGAAALAAGFTPLEYGGDIGGSIRIPASFCGIYGHRPSETLVPRYGYVPGPSLPNPAIVMGVQGPLARSATDLKLGLKVIAGPPVGEDVAWQLQLPPSRHQRLSEFRVAVLPPVDWLPVDHEITEALENLVIELRQRGVTVARVQPESFDLREHEEVYTSLMQAITYADLDEQARALQVEWVRHRGGPFSDAELLGLTATASQLFALLSKREQYRAIYRDFFKQWDVLLTPVTITYAFEHINPHVPFASRKLSINGEVVPYAFMKVYPGLATLSGQPATAFPWGRSKTGLPLGLQVIGPYLEDYTPITFAELLEREFGGFVAPQSYLR